VDRAVPPGRRPGSPARDPRGRAIEEHLGLVEAIARRFASRGEPLDDLVQAGTIGLIKAVDRFDPERGVALPALAAPLIEGEIRHHLRDRAPLLRTPRPVRELAGHLDAAESRLAAAHGRAPTTAELAHAVGASEEAVRRALAARRSGTPVPLPDVAEPEQPDEASEARLLLAQGWRALSERERRVLELRFHRDLTQAQIAQEVGLSQATVSRIIRDALDRLRATLDGPDPAAYSERPVESSDATSAEQPGHSGRLLLRMPHSLHAELAGAAEREGVSLNALIVGALAGAVGWRDGEGAERLADEDAGAGEPAAQERPAVRGRWAAVALAANIAVVALTAAVAVVLLALAVRG
jgi:RNA polymerase sigma-B factor